MFRINTILKAANGKQTQKLPLGLVQHRTQNTYRFLNDANIFDLTDNVVKATIEIRKKHKTKLPDAIIAAIAMG